MLTDEISQIICDAMSHSGADSRRVLHGRGGCFPGFEVLTVDLYEPVILLSLYANSDVRQMTSLESVTGFLVERMGQSSFHTLLIHHRYSKPPKVETVFGEHATKGYAIAKGQRFELDFQGKQNIGFFLDAQPARDWLASHCHGRRVLNLFAYTCAFSVVAIAAGAAKVFNVDMSKSALRVGQRNHTLNFSEETGNSAISKFLPYEIFRSLPRLVSNGPYDLIIVDPPSFQPGSFVAKTDYPKLLRKLPRLLRSGAYVLLMLNAPNLGPGFLLDAVQENCPKLQFCGRLSNSADFPDQNGEQALKMLVFQWP